MFDWLNNTESVINWLADCLIGWSNWQHAQLIKKLTEYLLDRLIDCLTHWRTTSHVVWLTDYKLTEWLFDWLNNWMFD